MAKDSGKSVNSKKTPFSSTALPSSHPSPTGRGHLLHSSPYGRGTKGEGVSSLGRGSKGEGTESETHYRGGFDFSGLVETARELRKNQTPAESVMWELLRDRRFMNLKFRRQHQFGNYIADFYCHQHKLVIELDGGVHESDGRKKHDHRRDAYLASMGLTVLRFRNEEFLADPETVLHRIADAIKFPSPPSSPCGRGNKGEGA